MKKADIAMIGLAVMGENLALNMESKGYCVAVYNRPKKEDAVTRFVEGRGKGKHFIGCRTIPELVESLSRPRKVMMMIRAGEAVDEMIGQLVPYLSPGDVIIDGGNSDFRDTQRRVQEVEKQGFLFIGTGVSGGEEGALNGPSIMPGGSPGAWPLVKGIFQSIAAKLDDGAPCCEWIGSGGAGHFVKMVHNGIEYGDMQLIAESYSILKRRIGLDNESLSEVFGTWNRGELDSFLVEITAHILRFKDTDGEYLLDKIRDAAGQKGTGKWSAATALDLNDPLTLITESVYARMLSALAAERAAAAEFYPEARALQLGDPVEIGDVRDALYASKLISYAQGFSLMRRASEHYGWSLDFGTIARIWRNGCIIRSAFLGRITEAFHVDTALQNLLFSGFFAEKIREALPAWRRTVAEGVLAGIALPCMAAALSYFDGLRTLHSAANLLQAQRDYFGAHMYERTDAPQGTFFHTNWTGKGGSTSSQNYNV